MNVSVTELSYNLCEDESQSCPIIHVKMSVTELSYIHVKMSVTELSYNLCEGECHRAVFCNLCEGVTELCSVICVKVSQSCVL